MIIILSDSTDASQRKGKEKSQRLNLELSFVLNSVYLDQTGKF